MLDKAIAFEGETSSVGWDNITGKPDSYPPETHTHSMTQVTGLEDELNSIQDKQGTLTTSIGNLQVKTDTIQQQIEFVKSDVDDKADINHIHEIADVTNLQTTLNGKAASSHNHNASNITSGTLPVTRGGTGQTSLTPAVTAKALRAIYAGTSDMTAGSTTLTTGTVYLVYE